MTEQDKWWNDTKIAKMKPTEEDYPGKPSGSDIESIVHFKEQKLLDELMKNDDFGAELVKSASGTTRMQIMELKSRLPQAEVALNHAIERRKAFERQIRELSRKLSDAEWDVKGAMGAVSMLEFKISQLEKQEELEKKYGV